MARKRKVFGPQSIQSLGPKGVGLAKPPGEKPIYVQKTMTGDLVELQITGRRKTHYTAKVQSFLKPSPHRIPAPCKHFESCGGCGWQMMPYDLQSQAKEKYVRELFRSASLEEGVFFHPILPAPEPYFYRNKMEFSFGANKWFPQGKSDDEEEDQERRGLGFYVPGRWDRILDLDECLLAPSRLNEIRNALKNFAMSQNISFYDQRTHQGLLRQLLVRTSLLDQTMVTVVFNEETGIEPCIEPVMKFLETTFPWIESLWYARNPLPRDSFYELDFLHWSGQRHIEESCGPLKLIIHPKSFYQPNPAQAVRFYTILSQWAQEESSENIWDLFCGTGSIGLFLAPRAKSITGIEIVPEAIENAKENAQLNHIQNAHFICATVEDLLNQQRDQLPSPDLVVLDPPRGGLHPKAREALLQLKAPRILYVSCNPKTQVQDLLILSEKYKIHKVQPVDLFPQTHHVENLVLLHRK